VKVRTFEDYRDRLAEHFVVLDRQDRHDRIARGLEAKASAADVARRPEQRDHEEEKDHDRAGVHDDLDREHELRAEQQEQDRQRQHHHDQAEHRADRLMEGDDADAADNRQGREDEEDCD